MLIDGTTLTVESKSFTAVLDGARVKSLVDTRTGVEFVRPGEARFPLELTYRDGEATAGETGQGCTVTRLGDNAARIVIEGEYTCRELFVRLDAETGDLCVRPSAESVRHGLRSVRWNLPFTAECGFVLPFQGGRVYTAATESLPPERTAWPSEWNAQMAVIEKGDATLMLHSEDRGFRYKALGVFKEDAGLTLGFEAEAHGPLAAARTAGGVEWRINTYRGGWQGAADRYRAWMERNYDLAGKRAGRPDWVEGVTLAVCWVGSNPKLLAPLARLNPPDRTLIHLSDWRSDPYDVNYPVYRPSAEGAAFVEKARAMGFRVMPHFNYLGCCKTNPLYERVRDWQARDVVKANPQGWFLFNAEENIQYRMAYIHPGLARWRRTLIDNVLAAREQLQIPVAFLDQTYHTWNTDNPPVENLSMTEGLALLQDEFAWAAPDLMLAGENLTEISFQRQCFAQLHNPGWWSPQPVHVETSHPICSALWGDHARYIGYVGVEPDNAQLKCGVDVYRKLGALPTIVARDDVAENPALIDPASDAMKLIRDWIKDSRP